MILGAIWFAWHVPTFFVPTLSQSHLSIPLFFANSVALSIVMTWLYIRTDGDLLVMILVHVMANYCGAIGIPFTAEVLAELTLAALIVACGGLRSEVGSDRGGWIRPEGSHGHTMYALRCTLPLLKRLGKPIEETVASTTALGDWFVRPLNVGRNRLLLCVSAASLLPVIIPAKDLDGVSRRLAAALTEVLTALRIPTSQIARELQAMSDCRVAKTNSRTVLGSMTDFIRMADWQIYESPHPPNLLEAALQLAEAPCGPINYDRPKDVARALLQRVV